MKVEICYRDGTSSIKEFPSEEKAIGYIQMEGDAVTSWRVLDETS